RRHPVLGGGAGSFVAEYRDLAAARGWTGEHVADNPHNEYLMVWSQFGLVGLALLLWLWVVQWRRASAADETVRYLSHGLLVLIAIGNLFNSLILDNMEGHLYALLSVALCAAWARQQEARA
ncbi:MAG: glycosyl transferase family 2, partial [Zoogloea sp.]|nr:glycosyl transferase family 2 [Zoogloea sp.]